MDAPWPLIEIAIEPTSETDATRLATVLAALSSEDGSLAASIDGDTGQIILGGISERHLAVSISRFHETHGIEIRCGVPKVAYRETPTKRIEKDYTHKKQGVGGGQFARVKLVVEPDATTLGTRFVCLIGEGAVPPAFLAGVEAGIAAVSGVLAGFPVTGVRITLLDGAYHEVDSSALAFEIAARSAFREALREGQSVLLEPIMYVTVTAPEEYKGVVTGDMDARGEVLEHGRREAVYVVTGLAPLANLFGYTAQLRALTQGRGSCEMRA